MIQKYASPREKNKTITQNWIYDPSQNIRRNDERGRIVGFSNQKIITFKKGKIIFQRVKKSFYDEKIRRSMYIEEKDPETGLVARLLQIGRWHSFQFLTLVRRGELKEEKKCWSCSRPFDRIRTQWSKGSTRGSCALLRLIFFLRLLMPCQKMKRKEIDASYNITKEGISSGGGILIT